MKKQIFELASHETLYDAIKWVVFGIFAIIYFGLKERSLFLALVFIGLFVLILYWVNVQREKGAIKIKSPLK